MATNFGVPDMAGTFAKIGELGNTYDRGRIAGARNSLSGLGPGNADQIAQFLFASGDIEGGMQVAQLAMTQAQREWTQKYQVGQLDVARQNALTNAEQNRISQQNADTQRRTADATIEGQRIPPGWRRTESGLQPIPEGPADPNYIHRTSEARQRPREFSISDITKLNEEGGKFSNLTGFVNTFQPRYSGFVGETVGNAAMWVGRNIGGSNAEAAQWWQQYDRFKNVVRNELFGAALTATEKAAFERADINPGMAAETIQKNLTAQQAVVQNGLKRKANAMIQSGYDPGVISQAYGVNLKELGVTAAPRRGGSGAQAPTPPASSTPAITPGEVPATFGQRFDAARGVPPPPPGFQIVR